MPRERVLIGKGRAVLFGVLLVLLSCGTQRAENSPPAVVRGQLDLKRWDFQKEPRLELDGQWEFFWRAHHPPAAFAGPGRTDGQLVSVPHRWRGSGSGEPQAHGYGTYRFRVMLPAGHPPLAFHIPSIRSAYRLFVNGQAHASMGVPTIDETGEPKLMRQTIRAPLRPGENEIILHVSNFHTRNGGILKSIELGREDELAKEKMHATLLESSLAGAVAIMALYFLGTAFLLSRERAVVFLGVLCAVIAFRTGLVGEKFLAQLYPVNGELMLRVEYLTLPTMMAAAMFLIRSLFPAEFKRWALYLFGFVHASYALVILAMPARFFTAALPTYQLVGLALFGGYMVFAILLAIRNRQVGARLILPGVTIAGLVGAGSIFKLYFDASGVMALVLILTFAFLLTFRFARALVMVEGLSGELSRKNQELQRLDRLKDEFLANTSHELRTPLNGIIGITESLLGGVAGVLEEPVRRNLNLVASSGRRLIQLVNDILDLAKLQHGGFTLQRRSIDLGPVVESVAALSQPLLSDRPVALSVAIEPDLPPVFADRDRVEQILHNLVGNAVKFTRQGRILITAAVESGRPNYVEVRVTDTGIGIPADKQELVFQSFTQADGSISRQYGGTGLGLGICRQLVELHGGNLSLESEPGRGSEFAFTLPVASDPGESGIAAEEGSMSAQGADVLAYEPVTVVPVEDGAEARAHSRGSESPEMGTRILIVDDDPVNLQVLYNHLSLRGHSVISAADGPSALQAFDGDERFDLILLDVMMPGLSGYEVCRVLRHRFSRIELPIIMLTARDRKSDLVAGFESGANDYLTKPFDSGELLARVETMAALKRAGKAQSDLALLEYEMKVAHTLQQSLLPHSIPQFPGVEIAVRYQAMHKVGGDFYDFRPDDKGVGVLVSDVSGHGVSAALIVSMVKVAFWLQKQDLSAPDQIFTGMEHVLSENIGSQFVTACYAYVDPARRILVSSNAGHPPVLVWRQSEPELIQIRPYGRAFGIPGSTPYDMAVVALSSGDRIFLYTDGLFEIPNSEKELFGEERLHALIHEHAAASVGEQADLICAAARAWAGGQEELDDDMALAIIRVE